jgi:hypothetical protein
MTRVKYLLLLTVLLLAATVIVQTQTPLTPLFNLRGKTDSTGALYVTNFTAATPDTPLTSLSELRGKTDSSGALYVTCTGCGSTTAATFTATTDFKVGADALSINEFNSGFITFGSSGNKGLYLPSADVYANNLQVSANGRIEFAAGGYIYSNGGIAFASLPAVNNGTMIYCNDCTFANPCASGGTGAYAKRLNGAWRCD